MLKQCCKGCMKRILPSTLRSVTFFKKEVVYLGFVVSKGSLKMHQEKVVAIINWPPPTTSTEIRIFYGLDQFYRNFSGICAPFLDTIKGGAKYKFKWTSEANKLFEMLKKQVATQHVFQLPSFEKIFTLA